MDEYLEGLIAEWEPGAPAEPEPEPERPRPVWRSVFADEVTGSWVRACDDYLSAAEQRRLFDHCAGLAAWEFDKPLGSRPDTYQRRGICMQAEVVAGPQGPRLCTEGYRYSGQLVRAAPLDAVLGPLLARVNAEHGTDFNSWFLNWYRARRDAPAGDYLSPHADNEAQLAVAADGRAVVFGLTLTDDPACVRELRWTRARDGAQVAALRTEGGQAYVMEGALQRHYKHGMPKALSVSGSRISLTARKFVR
jgi:alkylated DNA repair dioxygenase AlkB